MTSTILQSVADGNAAAVDECLGKYGGLVWSLARRLCPRHEDAEDAVQEIFVEIWRNAAKFDPEIASEATYVTMIARRRLIDRNRRARRGLGTNGDSISTRRTSSKRRLPPPITNIALKSATRQNTLRGTCSNCVSSSERFSICLSMTG